MTASDASAAWRAARPRPPPGTWRLLAPAILVWAIAAIGVVSPGLGPLLVAGAGGAGTVALLGALLVRGSRWMTTGFRGIAVACAAVTILGASLHLGERGRDDAFLAAAADAAGSIALDGALEGFPRMRGSGAAATAWVTAQIRTPTAAVPAVLWLGADHIAMTTFWGPGTPVAVVGTVVRLETGSSAAYGIRIEEINRADPRGTREVAEDRVARFAAGLRARLRTAAEPVLGAELVPGFAVGDTALVDERLERRMQRSSLTHLVAVSGANCALIIAAVGAIAARLGAGRRSRVIIAGAALAGFVMIVGPDASVQRAAIMAAVMLLSGFGGKRAVSLPALAIAMLAMLIADPWQALQPGFALSVAATAGILLLVPEIEPRLRRLVPVPRWAALPVAVALAAQISCGPLLLLVQPDLPAAGVLANVLAAPAAPLGTGLGIVALVLLPFSEPLGTLAVHAASLPARWVAATAQVTADLPLARWPWPEGWGGAVLLGVVETALIVAWAILARRLGYSAPERRPWGMRQPLRGMMRAAAIMLIVGSGALFAGPTVLMPLVERNATPADWFLVACDIGQGDAILLRDPSRPSEVVLVDTGDRPEALEACLQRFGVARIGLLILTHDDRDHVGALSTVIDRTDAVLVAPDNLADGPARPLLDELAAARVRATIGQIGMTGGVDGLRWEVLAPESGRQPADTNAASLVLRVEAGMATILLLGDTGAEEQRALLRSGRGVTADVVKVAHHGSRDQAAELPAHVRAELGVISVGAENGYGHPSDQVIAELERAGSKVLRTDRHGSIAVSGSSGRLRAWTERRGDVAGAE